MAALGLGTLLAARAWHGRRHRFSFTGRSVVITGASRGLGLVMARLLAGEGARLTLVARDEAELDRASADIRDRCPSADLLVVAGDIRRRVDAERAIAQTLDRHRAVDVVMNNAGTIQVGPLEHMKLWDFEDAMNTHFWGPLHVIRAALPHMRRQRGGRIVNVSSIGGRIAMPHLVPYSASKFALVGLSDGLRAELAAENIFVTTVCPGLMRTGSPVNARFKGRHEQEYAWFAIADSLPLATVSAERAARQIIEGCRRGDAEVVVGLQARLAVLARTAFPGLFARAMTSTHRLLPRPATSLDGDVTRTGRESESTWANPDTRLTAPTYAAAGRNNELSAPSGIR
jgi:short-subunit dehydrogenase